MKKMSRKLMAILLAFILVISVLPATAYAADNGPYHEAEDDQEFYYSGIIFYAFDEEGEMVWEDYVEPENPQVGHRRVVSTPIFEDGAIYNDAIEGVSYDLATNTLTLDHVCLTDRFLVVYNMGEDFRIDVVHDSELGQIRVSTYQWKTNLNIVGDGMLAVNTNKVFDYAIKLSGANMDVSPDTTLFLYGKDGAAVTYDSPSEDGNAVFSFHGETNGVIDTHEQTYEHSFCVDGYLLDRSPEPAWIGNRAYSPSDPDGIYVMGDYWTTDDSGERVDGKWVEKYVYSDILEMYVYDTSFGDRGELLYLNSEADKYDFEELDGAGALLNENRTFDCIWDLDVMRNKDDSHRYAVGEAWSVMRQGYVAYVADFEPIDDVANGYVYTVLFEGDEARAFVENEDLEFVMNGDGCVTIECGYVLCALEPHVEWLGRQVATDDDPDGLYYMTDGYMYEENEQGEEVRVSCYSVTRYNYDEALDYCFEDYSFGKYGTLDIPQADFDDSGFYYVLDDKNEQIERYNTGRLDRKYCALYVDGEGNEYACYTQYHEDDTKSYEYYTYVPIDNPDDDEDPDVLLTPVVGIDPDSLTLRSETVSTGEYCHTLTPTDFYYYGENTNPGGDEQQEIDTLDVGNVWSFELISNNPACPGPRYIPFTGEVNPDIESCFVIDEIWTNTTDGSTASLENGLPLKPGYTYTYTMVVNDRPGYRFADNINFTYLEQPAPNAQLRLSEDRHTLFITGLETVTFLLDTPTGITATAAESSVNVGWNATAGAEKYRVFRKEGAGKWAKVFDTTGTSFVDTTVVSGKTYAYTVRCLSQDGKVYESNFDAAGACVTYVAAPQITKLESAYTGVQLTITKPAGAAKVRIFKKVSGKWTKLADTTAATYIDTKAVSGENNTYTVRALDAKGAYASAFKSAGWTIKFAAAPKITRFENQAKGTKITWSASPSAAKYRVFVQSGTSWKKLADVTTTSYINTAVKAGTAYTYTVRAIGKDGKYLTGYNPTGWKYAFIAAPALPAMKNTKNGVQITITKSAGAAQYRIFRKTGSGSWAKVADTTALTYTDKTAKNGVKYTYTIRCLSKDGKSYTSAYNTTGKTITCKR